MSQFVCVFPDLRQLFIQSPMFITELSHNVLYFAAFSHSSHKNTSFSIFQTSDQSYVQTLPQFGLNIILCFLIITIYVSSILYVYYHKPEHVSIYCVSVIASRVLNVTFHNPHSSLSTMHFQSPLMTAFCPVPIFSHIYVKTPCGIVSCEQ